MPEAELRVDRHGIPHHAYLQANGNYVLCKRKTELCRDCGEYGVPAIPPDPFEMHCDLFREHWDRPWRERFFTVPEPDKANLLRMRPGAHIVALIGSGPEIQSVDLGWFGEDESIMLALGALVHVHNEMVVRPSSPPHCMKCRDTGTTDYAGFAMDPCDHGEKKS